MSDADTYKKVAQEWELLYRERDQLWRGAEEKLDRIRAMLSDNGCDCECDCDGDGHGDECEPCFACLVSSVVDP